MDSNGSGVGEVELFEYVFIDDESLVLNMGDSFDVYGGLVAVFPEDVFEGSDVRVDFDTDYSGYSFVTGGTDPIVHIDRIDVFVRGGFLAGSCENELIVTELDDGRIAVGCVRVGHSFGLPRNIMDIVRGGVSDSFLFNGNDVDGFVDEESLLLEVSVPLFFDGGVPSFVVYDGVTDKKVYEVDIGEVFGFDGSSILGVSDARVTWRKVGDRFECIRVGGMKAKDVEVFASFEPVSSGGLVLCNRVDVRPVYQSVTDKVRGLFD